MPTLISPAVIERLAVFGPRYTSYPTADRFSPQFTSLDYRQAASRVSMSLKPVPLSIYVHIPFCRHACFYCACNKISTQSGQAASDYIVRLLQEIDRQSALYQEAYQVNQLHFGGGTPTFLTDRQLDRILTRLTKRFSFTDWHARDWSIEIDPRTVTPARLHSLAQLGFNRVSFGIQDTNIRVQHAINRIQSDALIRSLVEAAKAASWRSIGFDLIYGLPFQTTTTYGETVKTILSYAPDQVSFFNYAHLPMRFPFQRRIDEKALPDAGERFRLFRQLIDDMACAGYIHIGLDHFARPGSELAEAWRTRTLYRSFQGYSTNAGGALVGLGASAISELGGCYAQNATHLPDYLAKIDEGQFATYRGYHLSADDIIRKSVIDSIMCYASVDFKTIETQYGIHFSTYFRRELQMLETLESLGIVMRTSNGISMTTSGRIFLRHAAMIFDYYLQTTAPSGQYSPTI